MTFTINKKTIGKDIPIYFIAELSCNHNGDINKALELVRLAKESGAHAVKMQHYTGDTITLKCDNEHFKLTNTLWDSKNNLWELFDFAHTPWEWTDAIQKECIKYGLDFFSSPFDKTAVDFLEKYNVPLYKVASMEIIDITLLKKIASTKKPVIMSTGMATISEIDEAIKTLKENGCPSICLLKCTSAYPAKVSDANLLTIPNMKQTFSCDEIGLSDHTLGISVPIASIVLGARVVEKHFIKNRELGGPDSEFSLEPAEFKQMVKCCNEALESIGNIKYGGVKGEVRIFRRSLFVVKDMNEGEVFIEDYNVRSIRPGNGLHTRYMVDIVGKKAKKEIKLGTPLSWDLIE